jgi:iron complex outermembrane receptor protein
MKKENGLRGIPWGPVAILMIMLLPTQGAIADSDVVAIHEIGALTVTAQKREESGQRIPESLTVLNEMGLSDAGIADMSGLSAHIPNLEFYNFGSRRHSMTFMRGIKSLHVGEPATGYYVDGVNYSKSYMFDFPLFDVERIEVLRGPQGTLYGRNTMAGVISVHTRKPDNETGAALHTMVGSENVKEIRGHVRAPLIQDRLFIGLAGLFSDRDGYMDNTVPGRGDDGRHMEGRAGRAKLRFVPTPAWDITLTMEAQNHDEGAFPFRRTERNSFVTKGVLRADKPYRYSHDFAGSAENSLWGVSLNAVCDTPQVRITSISAYYDYDDKERIDSDFSPLDMTQMAFRLREQTFSQELRFASQESAGSVEWVAGVSGFRLNNRRTTTTDYRPGMAGHPNNPFGLETGSRQLDADGIDEGAALFGQITFPLQKRIRMTLGLGYEYEKADMKTVLRDAPRSGPAVESGTEMMDNDFSAILPKISLSCHPVPEQTFYLTVSRAHRSGGFNTSATGGNPYDEEYSWVYETGSKSRFLNGRITLNLAAFYMDIRDEQITLFDPSENRAYIENAGQSHRMGVEAEIHWEPARGLLLMAAGSVLEARYDRYSDPVAQTDYKGNRVMGVPDYTFSLASQYRCPLWGKWGFFGRAELAGTGNRYFDDANTVKATPHALVNLRLGIEGDHLDLYLWARNVFDRHYILFENVKNGVAEDGEPLSFGVSLACRF